MDNRPDEIDALLDQALLSYGEAPRNEGLESRVLARVSERARRKGHMRSIASAAGAIAALVVVCVFWWHTQSTVVEVHPAIANDSALRELKPSLPVQPDVVSTVAALVPAKAGKIKRLQTLPKLPQFPAPAALSEEERAVIKLVALEERAAPQELNRFGRPISPVQIAAIEIRPLKLGWNTKERKCCEQ